MKFFYLALISLLWTLSAASVTLYAQTALTQGDIVVLGVHANANCNPYNFPNGEDVVHLAFLVDIVEGTIFHVTDQAYFSATNTWGNSEGTVMITYEGVDEIPAGTVITFRWPGSYEVISPSSLSDPDLWDFSPTTPIVNGNLDNLNVAVAGDQLHILTDGNWFSPNNFSGEALYAYNNKDFWMAGPPNAQNSDLHPDVNPCFYYNTASGVEQFSSYQGPTSPTTRENWIVRITDHVNWTSWDSCTSYQEPIDFLEIVEFELPDELCEDEGPIDLPTHDIDGTWSGEGVTGNQFDPSGLSGEIDLTFTPDNSCIPVEEEFTIEVIPLPGFQNVETNVQSCGPYELPDIDALNPGVSNIGYYPQPNGQGIEIMAGDEIGISLVLYLFGGEGDCTEEIQINITVNNPTITSSFDDVTVCESYQFLPFSGNQALGYYSEPGGEGDFFSFFQTTTQSGTYYAYAGTPDCFVEEGFEVTILELEVPEFDLINEYCINETPQSLPGISDNDIEGSWSPASINTSMVGTTTYTFTPDTACAEDFTLSVTINNAPTATAENDGPYCEGGDIELTSSGGTSYSWEGPDGFASTEQNPTLTNSTSAMGGAYTVTVTDDNGCTAEGSTTVEVNANPMATADNTGPYCEGEDIELTSSGGTSYSWEGPDGFTSTDQNPNLINGTPSMSGTYTVTVTDSNGCTAEDNTEVTVNENPDDPVLEVDCSMGVGNGIITVTSPTGSDFEYSLDGGASQPSPEFTGLANGSYTVVVINADTDCESEIETITVDCGCADEPEVNLSLASGEVCGTESIIVVNNTFGGSATEVTLTHDGSGTLDPTNSNDPSFNFSYTPDPADVGSVVTITVVTDNPLGAPCEAATATFMLTINENPDATAENDGPYCEGEEIELTSSGGTSYSWEGPDGFTSTEQNPTLSNSTPAMGGTYSVTVTDDNGCTADATTLVEVSSNPMAAADNTGPYCEGEDIELTSSVGETFSWSGPGGFVSTEQNPTIANSTIAMGGTYTVTVTDENGCTDESSTTVEVNENPANPVLEVDCSMGFGNGSITVTSPIGPDFEYSLNGGASQADTVFNGLANGTYTVVVINTETECESDEEIIVVDCGCAEEPEVDLSLASDEVCGTESINVVNNTFGGSATEVTLTHNGSGTLDPINSSDSPFNFSYTPDPADVGSMVTITVETDNPLGAPCEPATATFILTINENPDATAENDGPYCEGEDIELTSSGGTSYSWEGPDGFVSTDQNPTLTNSTPAMGGTYTVTVTDDNGCTDEASTIVEVNSNPMADADNTGPYCEGEDIELISSGGTSYSWEGPDGFSSMEQNPVIPGSSIENAGTYVVTVFDAAGCTATSSTEVTINPAPVATATNDGPVCEDEDVQLSAEGGDGYSWEGPFGFNSTEQNPLLQGVGMASEGIYTVTVTDASGCTATATTEVVVHDLPSASVSGNSPVCEGETILLMASGGATYEWSGPAGFVSTEQNPEISNADPAMEGLYTVIITDANGCSVNGEAEIEILDSPDASASSNSPVCPGEDINLTGDGGVEYNWSGPAGFSSTDQNPVIPGAAGANAGTYSLTVTDAEGCTSTASTLVEISNPVSFLVLSSECAADLQSYTVIVSTDGDEVVASEGTVTDLGGGEFEISGVDIDNNLMITATNSVTGCSVEFTVNAPNCDCPVIAAPQSGGNQEICEGDPLPELSATVGPDLQVNWYDAATGGNLLLENSETFTPPGPGIYYAEAFDPVTECVSVQRTPVILTVNPNPEVEFVSANCAPDLLTYTLIIETDADMVVSSLGTVTITGGGIFEISEIPEGEPVTITAENSNTGCTTEWEFNGEDCECPVIDPPVSGGDLVICEGDVPGEISATVPGGLQVNWYDEPSGGILLLENSETFTPSFPGIFYAEAVDPVNGCTSDERTPVAVIEDAEPEFEEIEVSCDQDLNTYTVQFSTDALNIDFSDGLLFDLGGGLYELVEIDINNNLVITLWNENEDCALDFEVEGPECECPEIPAPESGGDAQICEGDPLPELFATTGPGLQINWYDVPAGGNPILENSETFQPTGAGTWYAEAFDPDSECVSEERTAVTLVINPLPEYSLISVECDAGNEFYTVVIETTADELITAQGNVQAQGGNLFEITQIPAGENLSFEIVDLSTGCSIQDEIDAPDCDCPELDPPTAVSEESFELCEGDVIPLLEVQTDPGLTVNWYDQPTGGVPLETESLTYQPQISDPGTYFFFAETIDPENDCTSDERTEFVIVIYDLPGFTQGLLACDPDGDTWYAEISTAVGNLLFSNTGSPIEVTPGQWRIENIDIDDDVVIDIVDPVTDCVVSFEISAPDCDCPQFFPVDDTTSCDFFILPEIEGINLTGSEAFYEDEEGQGAVFNPGDTIFESGVYYIYDQQGDCETQISFEIQIDELNLSNEDGYQVTECGPDPMVLFILADYVDLVNEGSGGSVSWFGDQGLTIPIQTNVQTQGATIYAVVTLGTCQSGAIPLTLNAALGPILENPGDLQGCDEVELPEINAANSFPNEGYYSEENGEGDFFAPGSIISESTTLYLFSGDSICVEEYEINIEILESPVLDSIADVLACGFFVLPEIEGTGLNPDSTFYFNQPNSMDMQYQAGDTLFDSGTYYAWSGNGACADQVSFQLTIEDGPVIDPFTDSVEACDFAVLPEISGSGLNGEEAYYTEPGGQGEVFQEGDTLFEAITLYAFLLIEVNGSFCESEELLEVIVFGSPEITLVGTDTVCVGEAIELEALGAVEYNWQGPDGFTSDSSAIEISNAGVENAGIYSVTATDANGCSAVDSIEVTIVDFPEFSLLGVECSADQQSWQVLFVSNATADEIVVSQGTIESVGNDSILVSNLELGTNLSIDLAFDGSSCVSSFFVGSPVCDCDDIDAPISGGDLEICEGESLPDLIAETDPGLTIDWYDAAVGGNLLLENSSSYTPSGAGTFFAEAVDTLTNCVSEERTAVTLVIHPTPEILFENSFCEEDGESWSVVLGSDADSVVADFGTVVVLSPDSILILEIPLDQDVNIQLFFAETDCFTDLNIEFDLNCDCDEIDAPVSGGDLEICEGDALPDLMAETDPGLTINWYDAAVGGNLLLENSSSYTPSGAGTFYAEAVDTLTNCVSEERTAVTLLIHPTPEIVFENSFCEEAGETWSVVLGSDADSVVADFGTVVLLSPDSILILEIPLDQDVNIQLFFAETGCFTDLNIEFDLNCDCDDINAPVSGGDVSVCEGDNPEPLIAVAGEGLEVNWYDAPTGGNLVLANDTIFLPPGEGTWYAESFDPETSCVSDVRTPVSFSFLPIPTAEILVTDCEDDEEFYFVTFTTDITNFWLMNVGERIENPDGSFTTSEIPISQSPVQLFLIAANGCRDTILISAPVCDCPELNQPLGGGVLEVCEDEDFPVFEATVDSGLTVNWYDSLEGGSLLLENSLSFAPAEEGVYYAESIDTTTGCVSLIRTAFELSLLTAPEAVLVEIECDDDGETYFVVLQTNSVTEFEWFLIGSGVIDIQPDGVIRITDIPISESIRIRGFRLITGLCERTYDIDPPNCECPDLNPPVSPGDLEICQGESIPPMVVEVDSGLTVNWYNGPAATVPVASGTLEFTPPGAGVFYAETIDPETGCVSDERTAIELTIHPRPLLPLIDPGCTDNDFYYVTIRTNADSVQANFGTITTGTNDTFRISGIPIDEDLVLLLVFTETGCQREFVIEAPDCDCPFIAAPVSAGDLEFCEGEPIPEMVVTVSAGLIVNWYNVPTGGNILVGNSPNFTPSAAGTYYAEAVDPATGCTSETRTAVTIVEQPGPEYELISIFCTNNSFYEVVFVSDGAGFQFNAGELEPIAGDTFRLHSVPVGTDLILDISLGPCSISELINSLNCGCPDIPLPVDSLLVEYCVGMSIPTATINLPDSLQLDWYDAPEAGNLIESNATEFRAPAPGIYYGEIVFPGTSCVSDDRIVLEVIEWPLPFADLLYVECDTEDGITAVFITDALEVLVNVGEVMMFGQDSFRLTGIPQGGEVQILLQGLSCVNIIPFIEEECSGCEPIVEFTVIDPPCPEVAAGSIEINAVDVLDLPADLSIDGDFVDIISEVPYRLDQLSVGSYTLSIESGDCIWEQNIVLSAPASEAQLITVPDEYVNGSVIEISLITNLNPDVVIWTPGGLTNCIDCTVLEYQVSGSQTITAVVQDSLGCTAEATLRIRPFESRAIFIPNVFSPNSDGVNDEFRPYFPADFTGEIVMFEIYDRWGNRMFARYDIPVVPQQQVPGWDGVFNGEEMMPAVYIYQLEVRHSDGVTELLQGEALLLR